MREPEENEARPRVVLRPIASPLPLGFLALAAGTFTLSGLQLSWIPPGQWHDAGLVILTSVVPLQLISCIYGFLARDSAAGTGTGLLAGAWLSIGAVTYTGHPGHPSGALGLLLLMAATALLVPVATAALSKVLASLVMGGTSVRFFLTAAYELSGSAGWKAAAGIAGLALAVLALYAGLAFELEDARRATLLPTMRHAAGRQALAGPVASETAGVHHEAGVRRKL